MQPSHNRYTTIIQPFYNNFAAIVQLNRYMTIISPLKHYFKTILRHYDPLCNHYVTTI